MLGRRKVIVIGLLLGMTLTLVSAQSQRPDGNEERKTQLAKFAKFEGTWTAQGKGFSSTLTYEWALPDLLLRCRNELRNEAGNLFGQYEGVYAWDPARSRIVFLTAGRDGELHQGEAEWRNEQLWHKAAVSGGRITGYLSVMEAVGSELQYRASYGDAATEKSVLDSSPLVYRKVKP